MPAAARLLPAALATAAAWFGGPAGWAQTDGAASAAGIYSCVLPDGRRLTSDRPIPECMAREQRLLNRDGSVRRVVPPSLSVEERAEREARERAAERERAAALDAVRRDRNLIARYPDEPSHRRARESALDVVRAAMKTSELRLRDLATERKPLLDEAEFYKGKPLPPKLKQQLDANDAAVEAQRNAALTQQAELERINRLYDEELARLRKLWAGGVRSTLDLGPSSNAR